MVFTQKNWCLTKFHYMVTCWVWDRTHSWRNKYPLHYLVPGPSGKAAPRCPQAPMPQFFHLEEQTALPHPQALSSALSLLQPLPPSPGLLGFCWWLGNVFLSLQQLQLNLAVSLPPQPIGGRGGEGPTIWAWKWQPWPWLSYNISELALQFRPSPTYRSPALILMTIGTTSLLIHGHITSLGYSAWWIILETYLIIINGSTNDCNAWRQLLLPFILLYMIIIINGDS